MGEELLDVTACPECGHEEPGVKPFWESLIRRALRLRSARFECRNEEPGGGGMEASIYCGCSHPFHG